METGDGTGEEIRKFSEMQGSGRDPSRRD